MIVELSTGVTLRVKAVSPWLLSQIRNKLTQGKPEVPKKFLEDDNRWIEVPEDPEYITAVENWNARVIEAIYDAMIVMGTAIESKPDDVEGPDDNGWIDTLKALDIEVPDDKRYLYWLKYIAASSFSDGKTITQAVQNAVGVSEKDVAAAAAIFRRQQGLPADPGMPPDARGENGADV